jgi:hypothetical protein
MNFPPENFRKPAHAGHAGAMRQFPTGQVDSIVMRVKLHESNEGSESKEQPRLSFETTIWGY